MVTVERLGTPAFVVDVREGGSFLYREGNRALTERTGLGGRLIAGGTPEAVLPKAIAQLVLAQYRACVATVAVTTFEEQFESGGAMSHWRTTLVPLVDPGTGRVSALLGTLVEITDTKAAERDLLRANAKLSLALQAVQGTHWEYDIARNHFEAAPSLALLLGEASPRVVSLSEWISTIRAEDRPAASFHALIDGSLGEQVTQFRVETPTGDQRWLRCRRLAIKGAGGQAVMIFGVTVDVTDDVLREQQLTREAEHDGLTALLNRRGFLARLGRAVAECEGGGATLTMLMLDLDRFKAVNDSFGHAAGDAVLAGVGQGIAVTLGRDDFAARLGGDEFAIVLRGLDPPGVERLVAHLGHRLGRPCLFRDHSIPVATSIGSATWRAGLSTHALIEAADETLYDEKKRRRPGMGNAAIQDGWRRRA